MENKTRTPTPSRQFLDLVPSDKDPKIQTSASDRRRLPRLALSTEQFRLERTGKLFSVVDLSLGGMAIRVIDQEDLLLFPVGTEAAGILKLRGERCQVNTRVRNLRGDVVGLEFSNLSAESLALLRRSLDPEILGQEMKPIPPSEPGAIWYHGSSGTDLLFKRAKDGRYTTLALFLLGFYVQWEEATGTATGRCSHSGDPEETRGIVRFETLLLNPDPAPDPAKLDIAKALILSSNLPQDLKAWCVRKLQSASGTS